MHESIYCILIWIAVLAGLFMIQSRVWQKAVAPRHSGLGLRKLAPRLTTTNLQNQHVVCKAMDALQSA
ncbi:hypothetical protein KCU61_g459, partial [Aureobasidium melanogenum]